MDIEAKKVQVQEDIARQPANVVFARIDIVNEIQLADLMKEQFTSFFDKPQTLLIQLLTLYTQFVSILQNKEHFYKVQL